MSLDPSILDPFLNNDEKCISLDLSTQNLSADDLLLISQIIAKNTHLRKLCLSNNRFSRESINQLAIGLSKNKSLKVLELNNCGLDCDDLKVLADALAVNQTVISLSLANNNIAYTGIKQLTKLQSLEILNISQNPKIGPGVAKLVKWFKNLTSLDISNNLLNPIALLLLARSNRLMRLDIRNTGNYSEMFNYDFFMSNYSLISLGRTLTGDYKDQFFIEFIAGNREAMLERYNNFINIVTSFVCHFVSYACQNVISPGVIKQPELWTSLPLDMQSAILKFVATTDNLHIGLNSLQIIEKISSVYQSAFSIVEQRKRRKLIETATHLTDSNIERWKNVDLKSSNIFDLFSGNEEYAIPDFLEPFPERALEESLQHNEPNSELISTLPLIPPVPETMRNRSLIHAATSLTPLSSENKLLHEDNAIPVIAWSDGEVDYDFDKDAHDNVNSNHADDLFKTFCHKEEHADELKRSASSPFSLWQSPPRKKVKWADQTPVTSPEKRSPMSRLR